jgi:hypothetical protein
MAGLASTTTVLYGQYSIVQTATFGPAATDVGGGDPQPVTDATFSDFQNFTCPAFTTCSGSWAIGAILDSVTIDVSGSVYVTGLQFTAPSYASGGFAYQSTTSVLIGSTGNAGNSSDINNLNSQFPGGSAAANTASENDLLFTIGDPTGDDVSQQQQIQSDETITYLPGPTTSSLGVLGSLITEALVGSGSFAFDNSVTGTNSAYNTTGFFTLNYLTYSQSFGAGVEDNLTTTQATDTTATYSVTYNYSLPDDSTPEPATMLLVGTGLLGLGMLRKRVRR